MLPPLSEPTLAKLFDVHMLLATTGRERSIDESAALLEAAGWRYIDVYSVAHVAADRHRSRSLVISAAARILDRRRRRDSSLHDVDHGWYLPSTICAVIRADYSVKQ